MSAVGLAEIVVCGFLAAVCVSAWRSLEGRRRRIARDLLDLAVSAGGSAAEGAGSRPRASFRATRAGAADGRTGPPDGRPRGVMHRTGTVGFGAGSPDAARIGLRDGPAASAGRSGRREGTALAERRSGTGETGPEAV